jgi:hypothetical protein
VWSFRYGFDRLYARACKQETAKSKVPAEPFAPLIIATLRAEVAHKLSLTESEAKYLFSPVRHRNTTYNPDDEHINVLFKDGTVTDISKVDNALIHAQLSTAVKKYYLCFVR